MEAQRRSEAKNPPRKHKEKKKSQKSIRPTISFYVLQITHSNMVDEREDEPNDGRESAGSSSSSSAANTP
jgi:hypothetical protein